ncbi:hypothetical protein [Solemya velum gill symbiont]|uniref:hypothetical protein n=1 Tax=Solemya velum gill symbiont TaxID=2340 RepID=UPI000998CCAF|nr:hypothetical protein [Solemya velum gill symbiont]OOY69467.1 hypothetical protein BOW07_09120 [Solemya velum gill symbiont]
MAKKNINNLTADELYELAEARKKEEMQKEKEELKSQVADLRAKKKDLEREHKKTMAAIDAEISQLTGRKSWSGGRAGGTSASILDFLASGESDTGSIRAHLEAQGFPVANLPQTMAYLKRTGRVVSTGRGRYKAA